MVGRLRKGEIDGFCAGEPWSRRASASKLGRLVAESGSLLPGLGEKVLGVRTAWHRSHSLAHSRLIRALTEASVWFSDPGNRSEAVEILASKRYVNTPKTVVEGALRDAAERIAPAAYAPTKGLQGPGADSPSQDHARWYLEQMARWGHVDVTGGAGPDLSSLCLEGFYQSVTSGSVIRSCSPRGCWRSRHPLVVHGRPRACLPDLFPRLPFRFPRSNPLHVVSNCRAMRARSCHSPFDQGGNLDITSVLTGNRMRAALGTRFAFLNRARQVIRQLNVRCGGFDGPQPG